MLPRDASAAATMVVAALVLSPRAAAQSASPEPAPGRQPIRQTVSLRPVIRRYRIDTTTVREQAATLGYTLQTGRIRFRLGGSPVRYTSGATTVSGAGPLESRLDIGVGRRDSLRFTLRTPSFPGTLGTSQVTALASAGTATVELESITLGTPAAAGARAVLARPVGSLVAALNASVEVEPRPGGVDSVYWRGVTVRGGAALTGFAGDFVITGRTSIARGTADSLAGRNLYPGGGAFTLEAGASGTLGRTGTTLADFSAFYTRPFGLTRPAVPNRLIPVGSLVGGSAALLASVGNVTVFPLLTLTRESSHANMTAGGQLIEAVAEGWTLAASLGLDLGIGRHLSLMPEAGVVAGRLRSDFFSGVTGPGGRVVATSRAAFSDPVSGWFGALEISVSW